MVQASKTIRYSAGHGGFILGSEDEIIYVTSKYLMLVGPREWLAPVRLSQLRTAMLQCADEDARVLYVSSDPPGRFDWKYPNHIIDASIALVPERGRMSVDVAIEREAPDEDESEVSNELSALLAGTIRRHKGRFRMSRELDFPEHVSVGISIPARDRTVHDALQIGSEIAAVIRAGSGGRIHLTTAVDLIRAGFANTLIGQAEGPQLDGKAAPYRLEDEAQQWEMCKDVASFANSEIGGVILIGGKTRRGPNGDVVVSVADIDLGLIKPVQYRAVIRARVHPRIEGLDISTVEHRNGRGVAYIHVPPQRDELKPFVLRGVAVGGAIRSAHVCIPVRDGEDTRYADTSEIHSLLQAGRIALRGPR